uniref:DUF3386 domain-containing protein n=1 Tax=Cyanothece sp. (strain PCC 7425 / ATCC 29141) TaxID=395961 RepID=B8HVF3_CYAP4
MTEVLTEQRSARDLFRAAYENRYTWDQQFPGYTADVELKQGEETYQAQIRVEPDFKVEVSGLDNEEVKESIYTQLRDVITHRKRNAFEVSHGNNTFSLGETDSTGAVEILVQGDAMGSNYRVRNNQISLVSRVMGRMAFVIHHRASLDTGEGYVSTNYTAVFRNPQTNDVIRQMEFEDSYEKFGNYYLMTRQVIHVNEQGKKITTEFNFSNLQLL